MSRKHNTAHPERGTSNYPARLAARGESNVTVRMKSLDRLRKEAGRRIDENVDEINHV